MIVERSMHDSYLSNAWLVADEPGGTGVFIDTGAPIEPLLDAVTEHGLTISHIINTHEHHDHTIHNVELQERFGARLVLPEDLDDGETLACGELTLKALSTPGHTEQHIALLVNDEVVFTGDVLFKGSVGGTMGGGPEGCAALRHSIMDVLMQLDHSVTVHPGHTDSTTIGAEWESNPFVRFWRGVDDGGDTEVNVAGNPGTLVVEATDYDGGTKALVRFADGREAIVGGGMLQRSTTTA